MNRERCVDGVRPSGARVVWRGGALLVVLTVQPPLSHAAIFGEDDRREWFEVPARAAFVAQRSLAMLRPTAINWCGGEVPSLDQPSITVGSEQALCESTRFADQPVLARCSAALLDRRLAIVAGHCVPDDRACADAWFAPGPRYAGPNELILPALTEVARCSRVVARGDGADVAIVELSRDFDVPPLQIAPLPERGANIWAASYPSGMPVKVVECTVQRVAQPMARVDCDLFHGSSGAGLFDSANRLFAVYAEGPGDYRPTDASCNTEMRFATDGTIPGITTIPQFGGGASVLSAVDALCATMYPTALCGTPPAQMPPASELRCEPSAPAATVGCAVSSDTGSLWFGAFALLWLVRGRSAIRPSRTLRYPATRWIALWRSLR